MANKNRPDVAEKVGEIKRRQANWMKERSLVIQDGSTDENHRDQSSSDSHTRKSRDKSAKKSTLSNKTETISWTCSSGPKRKPSAATTNSAKPQDRQKTLRTRSASPGRNSKQSSTRNNPPVTSNRKSSSRPSSARSNISEGSRPPSGRTVTPSTRAEKLSLKEDKNSGLKNPWGFEGHTKETPNAHVYKAAWERIGQLPPSRVNSVPNLSESEGGARRQDKGLVTLHDGSGGRGSEGCLDGGDEGGGGETNRVLHSGRDLEATHTLHSNHHQDNHDDRSEDGIPSGRTDIPGRRSKPTLDPDAFDRLADQIASKVKAEMKEEKQDLMGQMGYTGKSIVGDDDGGGRIEGHYCTKCKQLMVPPDHAPTMLVPCGHTFCEACSEDRIKCPTCRTRITSTSLNTSLQDIILAASRLPPHTTSSKTHAQNTPVTHTHHDGMTQKTSEYTPAKYTDTRQVHLHHGGDGNTYPHGFNSSRSDTSSYKQGLHSDGSSKEREDIDNARTRKNNIDERPVESVGSIREGLQRDGSSKRRISPEEEARKLENEFQSLGIRCEALESEEADVMERIEKQNKEISRHKQQTCKITHKQDELREEIKILEGRLADLEGHRQEYKKQVEDAEDKKREELDQLAMVRTMLRDMQRNRERVKMSARKLDLSLD